MADGSLPSDEDIPVSGENYVMDFSRHFPFWKQLDCPKGLPGDRLYVRENYRFSSAHDSLKPSLVPFGDAVEYFADTTAKHYLEGRLRPSIHMPRWASRITLEITGVRVERLNDISEEGAQAEGVDGEKEAVERGATWFDKPRRAYRFLWESINGEGSWDLNPWVWVIEFKRVQP